MSLMPTLITLILQTGLYRLLGIPVIRFDSALCVIWMLLIECNLQVVPGADESR